MYTSVSRRTFFKTLAVGGAALRHGTTAQSADGMFVSLNSSLTRQMDWPDFARLAARVGYRGVDVNFNAARFGLLAQAAKSPSGSARASSVEENAAATLRMFRELKLKPGVCSLPVRYTNIDASVYQDDMRQLDDAAEFAAEIGCPRMMAVLPPSSQTPKPELRKILKDRLLAINDALSRANVRLGLEFLGPLHFRTRNPHEFIWRMDEALEFAKECGPNIGLTLDAWHWHHAGATAADILNAGKSRIVHIHVSDARQQPPEDVRDNQRLMPGEGVIDLTTFFRSLQKIGYTDAVSPEPLGRVPKEMTPEEGAKLGLESTLAVMKKAGVF